jgi:hypothetical protein
VEVLLVAAGRAPTAALPAAELLVGLSAGSAELLLKQLDVLLQVGTSSCDQVELEGLCCLLRAAGGVE